MYKERFIKIILYSLVGATCLAFIVFELLATGSTQEISKAFAQATTKQSETFTELYFENHTHLPVLLAHSNQFTWYNNQTTNLYTFSFTIHNLENKDMTYTYDVYALSTDTEQLDQGEIFVKNNESKTITENFTLPTLFSVTKILVNLPEKNQQISFWMEGNDK